MELSNFCQYDKKFAFKIIGRLIQRNRKLLNKNLDDLSQLLQISPNKLALIERGLNYITQEQFNLCIEELKIQPCDLQEAYYIIESNYLLDVYRELDENFPI